MIESLDKLAEEKNQEQERMIRVKQNMSELKK